MATQQRNHEQNLVNFVAAADKALHELMQSFALHKVSENMYNNSAFVIYKNHTTAVQIGYEPMDRGVFALLIRLRGEDIPQYPTFISQNDTLDHFYLDDLVSLRKGNEETAHKNTWRNFHLDEQIKQIAYELQHFAKDILCGDFSIFSALQEVVMERAAKLRSESCRDADARRARRRLRAG